MCTLSMTLLLSFMLSPALVSADQCASTLGELQKTERLRGVQGLLNDSPWAGLVNETEGSYILFEVQGDHLEMSFFTTGLFDLYPIKRSGPVSFCDSGEALSVHGLGRVDQIQITPQALIVNGGGPKMTFHIGAMPPKLSQMHHLEVRGIASQPPAN